MARITCDDCLEHIDNRYELVHLASDRVRQLVNGYNEPLIDDEELGAGRGMRKDKETVIALREIAASLITTENIADADSQSEGEDLNLNLDDIISSFEEVDKKMEEERRLAEEKGSE